MTNSDWSVARRARDALAVLGCIVAGAAATGLSQHVDPGMAGARTAAGESPLEQARTGNLRVVHPGLPVPLASGRPVWSGPDTIEHARWADSVLATLSLRAKVGQMMMRWIPGTFAGTGSAQFARERRWITRDSLGGFIISIGTPESLARKTNALQRLARVPLLFSADLEFGPGQRLIPGGAVFPPPMGIAATGDTTASCAHGRITALEARAVGIHWTFSPDVDVNRLPDNPIVNTRAYGETPETVERFATPFIRCAEEAGLLTTAKHLVGKGETTVDSHLALPILPFDRARLDSIELPPFRAAQRAGVSAMMSGHVALPQVTGDSIPLSLHPRLLASIVREELDFEGLLVTDAMWMGGVTRSRNFDVGRSAVRAILAGNDVILDPRDHASMITAIIAAVRAGELTEARIDSSVRRILLAKAKAGLHLERQVDVDAVARVVGFPATDSVVAHVAQRSIVLARDPGRLVPLDTAAVRRIFVVSYLDEGVEPAPGLRPSRTFTQELRRLAGSSVTIQHETTTRATGAQRYTALATRAAAADMVILAPFIRPIAERGTIGLPAAVERFYERVLARQPKTIIVSFGDPYLIRQLPDSGSYLLAWNPWSPPAERAAARALTGHASITGRLPVTLGPRLPRRLGIGVHAIHGATRDAPIDEAAMREVKDTVQRILDQAVRDSAFPGAIAVVGNAAGVIATVGTGTLDWTPSPVPGAGTIWDLASLTKVIGLTTVMMQLVEAGRVELDAPVQRYLPEWTGPGKDSVTIRHLLTHTTGLPAFRRLYLETQERDSALAMVLATPLDTVPGARMVYSDFGLILAGLVVERVTGERVDRYLEREVFRPLGMHETMFRPGPELLARIAPTEFDPWRQRHVRGQVHDENTVVLGEISSHAGLFSTGRDLARFARMYLNGGELDGVRIVSPRTISLFTRVQDPALSHRALGWETPTGRNSAGRLLSAAAFGHTGYTGTSLWIDPANDLFVLLLTNRVNPTRENTRVFEVRASLADAVVRILAPAAPTLPPIPSP